METAGGNCPLVKGNLGVRLAGRAEWARLELKAQESLGARSRVGLVQALQAVTEGQMENRAAGWGVDP